MDDDAVNHMVLEGFLKPQGYHMEIKMNGQEALDYLQDVEELPDVILLDWMMPGMSGLDVAKHVKAMYPKHTIPIIMVRASPHSLVLTKSWVPRRARRTNGVSRMTHPCMHACMHENGPSCCHTK